MKVKNYLLGYKDTYIIQDTEMFNFSLDSVLLPNFVTLNPKTKKILDIGTGNAPIPLILSKKTNSKIIGVEIQKDVFELAKESIKINNLEEQIEIVNEDINEFYKKIESDTFDVITCNPPFFKNVKLNQSDYKVYARHEKTLNLEQIFEIASNYLENNGIMYIINRSERLDELINLGFKYNIGVKEIQLIKTKENGYPTLVIVKCIKNSKKHVKINDIKCIQNFCSYQNIFKEEK